MTTSNNNNNNNNGTNYDKKRKSTYISTNNNSVNGGDAGGNSSNNHRSNNNTTGKFHYKYQQQQHQYLQNPKRGGPGILLTCETGREYKARNEALEILHQDWIIYQQQQQQQQQQQHKQQSDTTELSIRSNVAASNTTTPATTPSENPLTTIYSSSLDDELKQLHSNRSRKNVSSSSVNGSPFVIYETGCKGTVLILYQNQHPTTTTSTSVNTSDIISNDDVSQNNKMTDERTAPSGQAITTTTTTTEAAATTTNDNNDIWDPCNVIYRIANDMKLKSPKYTSSRYISRMIPIQKTCYATIDDIVTTVQILLEPIVQQQHNQKKLQQQQSADGANNNTTATISTNIETINDTKTTFGIQEKRRFCNHIKREPLIIAVGNVVGTMTKGDSTTITTNNNNNNNDEWVVNLTKPDYTIWIDICKTIAGISIISNLHLYPKNFNLVEYRLLLLQNMENIENDTDGTTTIDATSETKKQSE